MIKLNQLGLPRHQVSSVARSLSFILSFAIPLMIGCTPKPPPKSPTAAPEIPPIIDHAAMKDGAGAAAKVDPCENFYEFACGAWLDKTVIPPEKKAVSRQVTAASDATDLILNRLLVDFENGRTDGPSPETKTPEIKTKDAKLLADTYKSCLDADQQTAASLAKVKDLIARIRTTAAGADRARLVGDLNQLGAQSLFAFGSSQDPNDSTRVLGELAQGGMGLESKDYYLNQDAKSIETRAKYLAHISKLFTLIGESPAKSDQIAKELLDFETSLAKASYSIADRNDPSKTNHPAALKTLESTAPHFDWKTYFKTLGDESLNVFNLDEPEFINAEDQLVNALPNDQFANYLIWKLVDSDSVRMGGAFEAEHFDFWDKYMSGMKEMMPRWKYCTEQVAGLLGYPLAEAYVQTFDGAAIKKTTEMMIDEIKRSFKDDLHSLTKGPSAWIDDATLKGALAKVDAVTQKVGAPTKWRDYSSVRISPASYLDNYHHIAQFESLRDLKKIGKPVDKTEWSMMPWEVNAYYERSNNEFVFPFGILQPPSLDVRASDGANFGAFGGGTIGHELTHGFDKNGSKYDLHGNLKNWWSPRTNEQFAARAQCYISQADGYHIAETDMNVNGAQTIDENLADQGGVKLGYVALESRMAHRTKPSETANWNGYNERQQYWIAYAQSWCTKATTERMRLQMMTNEHPVSEYRVNGVVMNRPEFAKDFNCKSGAKMAPLKRCSIW